MAPRDLLTVLLPCALGLLLAACSSGSGPGGSRMSFASMQAINPGVEGDWIIAEYPFARNVSRRPDGSLQSLGYQIEDPQGKGRPLMLHFDETGMLVRKQYGGPLVRPPASGSVNFDISGNSQNPASKSSTSKGDRSNASYTVPGGYVSSRNLPPGHRPQGRAPVTTYGPPSSVPPVYRGSPAPPGGTGWGPNPGTPKVPPVWVTPSGTPPRPPPPPPPPQWSPSGPVPSGGR